MSGYGFSHWRVNGWRIDRLAIVLMALSVLLMWTFEIWTIYLEKPYTYFMLSVVYVGFNMIPMTILTYLIARSMAKPLEGYELLDADPVEDYKTYLKEIMTAQRVKIDAPDSLPLGPKEGGNVTIHLSPQSNKSDLEERKESSGRIDVRPAASNVASSSTGDAAITIAGGDQGVGVKESDRYKAPIWQLALCYASAIIILLVYSLSVALIKDGDGFGNTVGWVTSGTIIILDVTVWLCVYGGKIDSPLKACLYQVACRIILVVFGDVYWFVGHSIMFIVLAVFFGTSIVNTLLPKLNGGQRRHMKQCNHAWMC